jgi:CBS domain-containing protein
MTLVRDGMVADPRRLPVTATAQEAGGLLQRPEVRAVYITDGDRLVGVVTRKTLVREVIAPGRDPQRTSLGSIAERPHYTIRADVPLDDAFRFLEAEDAERVPVVDEEGRLVGVLSRSAIRRRLAEDEEPAADDDGDGALPPAA